MIKVMSFNIRYGSADDGENRWDRRKSLVLDRIRAFGPDLLGLQECRDDSQANFVKQNLPDYEFYGVRRGGGDDASLEMAPVLFRKASFDLFQKGHFWLSETPALAGSKSWDSLFARTVTWVELVQRPSGHSLVFANTHFDLRPQAIERSAQMLSGWASQFTGSRPIILSGDFNADKSLAAYRILTGNRLLVDAYRQAHPNRENEATFHGFGQPEAFAAIDWILVSGQFRAVEAAVDRSHEGTRYPSDHYPLTAVLD